MVLANYQGRQLCSHVMAMPTEADEDLARALTATIFGVVQRMKQDSARKAADWDVSVPQVRALYALRDPLSMRELAERLYLDPSNLTALVDRLEDLGLVERQADADDRRVKRLVITEKGVHLSEEIIDAVFAEGTVFDVLDADEQRQLLDLLGQDGQRARRLSTTALFVETRRWRSRGRLPRGSGATLRDDARRPRRRLPPRLPRSARHATERRAPQGSPAGPRAGSSATWRWRPLAPRRPRWYQRPAR